MHVRPMTLAGANKAVAELHRHHKPVRGHRFSVSAYDGDRLCGVAIAGRPVARGCDPQRILEVTRVATDGTPNTCSLLYGACRAVAKAMGFEKIQTYTLASEGGTSLHAAGWVREANVKGRQWVHTDGRPRRTDQPNVDKVRWSVSFRTWACADNGPEGGALG